MTMDTECVYTIEKEAESDRHSERKPNKQMRNDLQTECHCLFLV